MATKVSVKVFVRPDKIDEFPVYPGTMDGVLIERHVERMIISVYNRNVRHEISKPTIEDGVL